MNIPSMLIRLGDVLGSRELAQQILLHRPANYPNPIQHTSQGKVDPANRAEQATRRGTSSNPHSSNFSGDTNADINIVVGYNGSPNSQTALDLTLWMAYQGKMATRQTIHVQVVYVIPPHASGSNLPPQAVASASVPTASRSRTSRTSRSRTVGLLERSATPDTSLAKTQLQRFEEADRILWQARNLAQEWRGVLKTHLRFGEVATELAYIAHQEKASVVLVGCDAAEHWLIRQLGEDFSIPVLGIPDALSA
jgi:hypothetical protein